MFRLMVATDRYLCRTSLIEVIERALAGGADAVQLRENDMSAGDLIGLAKTLREITRRAGAALLINHRLDIAMAVGADGVHLGWRSLDATQVRALVGDSLQIGVSCHNAAELVAAASAGANYVVLGPVFATPSKKGLLGALGVDRFRALAAEAVIPVIGIGGITANNAAEVIGADARGVAVISAVMGADDPAAAVQAIIAAGPQAQATGL